MINFDRIEQIYGVEMLKNIKENKEEVGKNIDYMIKLNFKDIQDIFERITPIFITKNDLFKNKINTLIRKLGISYVEIIENNLEILEELI